MFFLLTSAGLRELSSGSAPRKACLHVPRRGIGCHPPRASSCARMPSRTTADAATHSAESQVPPRESLCALAGFEPDQDGGEQAAPAQQQTPVKPGNRTGADGLRPGDEGFRSAVTAAAGATLEEAAAAKGAATAQAQREDRARVLAEKREAVASTPTPAA